MFRIKKIGTRLAGTLGEAYYKEFCARYGWAYISLEQIHEQGIKNGILKFKKGFDRVLVKLPEEIIPEITKVSKPSNESILSPSFVYDFLAVRIGPNWKEKDVLNIRDKKDFCWVEVKTGESDFSYNQMKTVKEITLDFAEFYIPRIDVKPIFVNITWNKDTPQVWLDYFRKEYEFKE